MLSIPFVSRNDGHGGQLLERIQGTLNSYIYYRDKYNWDIEIIFVEWNPPPNKLLIRDMLTYPDNFPIKFIEVSPEMHNRYANSDKIALFSAIAMNVAMRRAKGNWVVSTTHDDIFSERLVTLLKNENFSEDSFYRAARYDTKVNIRQPIAAILPQLNGGVVKKNDPGGPGLFTKAAGDFIMMSKDNWNLIQGYPEWPCLGMFFDGITISNAWGNGLQQIIFPYPVYHIEHGNKGETRMKVLPTIKGGLWKKIKDNANQKRKPYPLNNPNWGLANCKEVRIAKNVMRLEGGSPPNNTIP